MATLSLEPYTEVQQWHMPAAEGRWDIVLGGYMQELAQRCASEGPCVIGHIKALVLFSDNRYVRLSVIAAHIPAGIDGTVPFGCTDLELTLNVLVYGLSRGIIERIVRETAEQTARRWKGTVNRKDPSGAGLHLHNENHQNHEEGSMSELLKQALSDLKEEDVLKLVRERLVRGDDPLAIIADCREGMSRVGKRYESGEYYVSDLIMAGEVFKQAMAIVGTKFQMDTGSKREAVVIGTVKGDIHDIGKDIVVSLLQAGNYRVIDLGVDVAPEQFVDAVKANNAAVVGLSGLLTTSFDAMKATVSALDAAGLRKQVKVMVGGGPVTEQVRSYVGADALGADAQAAVTLCDQWSTTKEVM